MDKINEMTTTPPEQPLAPAHREPIAIGQRGLELRTFDDMYRFARVVSASDLAPQGLNTPEKIFVAVQYGMEVGLTPMAAIQNVYVVHGKPALWGDVLFAIARQHPMWDENAWHETEPTGTGDARSVTVTMGRKDGQPKSCTFTMGKAKSMGLIARSAAWKSDPDTMLAWRARWRLASKMFAEVFKGIQPIEIARDEADPEPPALTRPKRIEPMAPEPPAAERVPECVAPERGVVVDESAEPDIVDSDLPGME